MSTIKRVACAVSGGVDSAVSALLLKRLGLDVVGVHMVNWDHQDEENSQCSNTKDLADARWVCKKIGIEMHLVNYVKEYWNFVFLNMLSNYKIGRTVVPDIECNRQIKFDLLHKYAFEKLAVDAVATGHFAKNSRMDILRPEGILLTATDPLKDQTYFLSALSSAQLKRSIFPVGGLLKSKVKEIAKDAGLFRIVRKKESMGICFVGKKRNFEEFLLKYIDPINKGRFVDSDSGVVLQGVSHSGVHNFTIGKRVRINSSTCANCEGYFVTGIDANTQTIYVCRGSHHPVLYATKFSVEKPFWIRPENEERIVEIQRQRVFAIDCRIQRIHPLVRCYVSINSSQFFVVPKIPLRAAAPGQICVFYVNDECLGCAEIQAVQDTLANRCF